MRRVFDPASHILKAYFSETLKEAAILVTISESKEWFAIILAMIPSEKGVSATLYVR